MKNIKFLIKNAAIFCIPVYIAFTFISHLFNTQINPLENWLSDFGNPLLNPSGAVFYNAGCITVAALLIIFYIGICKWYRGFRTERKYIISYVIAQTGGIVGAVFLILSAIFTLGTHTELHSFFSTLNMIGMDFFLTFTATAFIMNPNINKSIGIFGFLSAAFNIITQNVFSFLYIAEWVYFLLFMVYMVIITLHYDRLSQPVTGTTNHKKN